MKTRAVVLIACLGIVAVGCGGGGGTTAQPTTPTVTSPSPSPSETPGCAPGGTRLHIFTESIGFDKECLGAPADTAFTIEFQNTSLFEHNIVIEDKKHHRYLNGKPVHNDTIAYHVKPMPAGLYEFYCKFHPNQMYGQFVVQ
jgi:hypothetical protein